MFFFRAPSDDHSPTDCCNLTARAIHHDLLNAIPQLPSRCFISRSRLSVCLARCVRKPKDIVRMSPERWRFQRRTVSLRLSTRHVRLDYLNFDISQWLTVASFQCPRYPPAAQPLQQILHDALQQIEFVSRHRQRLCTRCRLFCGNGNRCDIGRACPATQLPPPRAAAALARCRRR